MTPAEGHLGEIKVGPFPFEPLLTDEWLGDAFYRECKEVPAEPKGIIPQG